jgi:hypothetical protein
MKNISRVFLIGMAFAVLLPRMLGAADKREIGAEELMGVLSNVKTWASAAVDLRSRSPAMNAQDFIKEAEALRGNFEEVILLIAQTKPSASVQQAAMLLAMGTKGVELGLWHYVYGALANMKNSIDYGDTLIKTAAGQLDAAAQLFGKSGP